MINTVTKSNLGRKGFILYFQITLHHGGLEGDRKVEVMEGCCLPASLGLAPHTVTWALPIKQKSRQYPTYLLTGQSFFFFKIYLFYVYEYTIAFYRYTRRGHQTPLQMVVSHRVVAGN